MSLATTANAVAGVPAAVLAHLAEHGLGAPVSGEVLEGGIISRTRRLTTTGGATVVLKTRRDAPPMLYRSEALGLSALAGIPGIVVPRVLLLRSGCLLLEDLGPQPAWDRLPSDVGDDYWDAFGRGLAHLHGRIGSRHGCGFESWWGLMRMDNRWTADGWEFFARTRLLWFLERPGAAALAPEDRRGVERLAARLRELVPLQPPCLCHGDLWAGNRAITRDRRPALLDPFVHYGWAEADLANCRMFGGFSERFYEAYVEAHPLEAGWRARLELYYTPHLLGMIDHGYLDCLPWLRQVLARFG